MTTARSLGLNNEVKGTRTAGVMRGLIDRYLNIWVMSGGLPGYVQLLAAPKLPMASSSSKRLGAAAVAVVPKAP